MLLEQVAELLEVLRRFSWIATEEQSHSAVSLWARMGVQGLRWRQVGSVREHGEQDREDMR